MISVCIATRNGSRFITEQIASILPQLRDGDEVIVSDDSSTDDTLHLLSGIADSRIMVLSGNRYDSPVFNMENALRHARGDIIVLADQDDVWLPGRLDLIREKCSGNSGVYLMMMDGDLIDEHGGKLGETVFQRTRAGKGIVKNWFDNCYTGCCLAFTRPLLDIALPFPARIPMHDMWLGILAEIFGEVEFVPRKTILYRRHGGNASFRSASIAQQIKRRLFLGWHLLERSAAVTMGWRGRERESSLERARGIAGRERGKGGEGDEDGFRS